MTIKTKLLTAATLSVLSFACAYADSSVATHSSIVHYNDLNLNQTRDVAKLYKRITVAANRVCGPRSLTGSNYKTADYQSCYTDAVAQAVAQIDHPSVTNYYRERGGEAVALKATIAQQ
jgi:UrcA family protein